LHDELAMLYKFIIVAVIARKNKTEAELLDQATDQLLAAIKSKASVEGKKVDYEKLRKAGYGRRFLARMRSA
jgi:hypothetical protein